MSKKIYIDAGHGGKDPGAVANGLKEKDLNLKVALFLGKYLKEYGCEIKYTRTTDIQKLNSVSTKEENEWGANLFVSIN